MEREQNLMSGQSAVGVVSMCDRALWKRPIGLNLHSLIGFYTFDSLQESTIWIVFVTQVEKYVESHSQ